MARSSSRSTWVNDVGLLQRCTSERYDSWLFVEVFMVPDQMGLVCIFYKTAEIVILSFEILTNVEKFSAFFLPQITLHVFTFEGPHFYSHTFKSVISLQLQFFLLIKLGLQLHHISRILFRDHICEFIFLSPVLSMQIFNTFIS